MSYKYFLSLAHFSYVINCPQKVIILFIFQLVLVFSTILFIFFSNKFYYPSNISFSCSQWTNHISEHICFHEKSQDQHIGHFSQSWMKPEFSKCWKLFSFLDNWPRACNLCFSLKFVKISLLDMLLPILDETKIFPMLENIVSFYY